MAVGAFPEHCADGVALAAVADAFDTPCYVYSQTALRARYQAFERALEGVDARVCFAVKANPNIGVLGVLADLGSGFDIVSVGELERVITAGGAPEDIVFSGVGKRRDELERALDVGVGCFNIESESELERLNTLATRRSQSAPISIRVNPDVDARTHPFIATGLSENKFGVDVESAATLYQRAAGMDGIEIVGVDCHIGSQLTDLAPFSDAAERVVALIDRLAAEGIDIDHLDIGGGLGVDYQADNPPSIADYVAAVCKAVGDRDLRLIFEPGRVIAADAGVLLTRVDTLKPAVATDARSFAVVDAAINDLIRPALYDAAHAVERVGAAGDGAVTRIWDVVGPICETGDCLANERELTLAEGDLLVVYSAGAYGSAMASNYNTRPRAPEVMLADGDMIEVRARESVADLMRGEKRLLPER
ncbi:diaminopimelate decarboxylase [Salinisphaera sp. USBA-960]|nr:diaminopimelate decarboxylase [Salifodinibacter halophilus]NNC27063.1 diaminopimelate decarboxylase [Salifodinibacter halophilus]